MVTSRLAPPPRRALLPLVLLAALAALAPPRAARAEPDKLAEARLAIEQVRYDQAQELLGEALREGGGSIERVKEIYTLAASTAVVLGKEDLAEIFYQRLLSVDPQATLDEDLAPKFKRPFSAAQAYVHAKGALRIRARALRRGGAEVVAESDPLPMIRAVRLAEGEATAVNLSDRRAVLPEARAGATVLALDEFGNELLKVTISAAPVTEDGRAPRVSVVRSWWVWAIPSGVALTAGVGAGLAAQSTSADLDDLLSSRNPSYLEAEKLRSRSNSRRTIANVSFAAAGIFAAVATVMWVTRPKERPRAALAPLLDERGLVGLGLVGELP
ncbi:MAG: hypothetical protein R3B48_14870 [Kofleriaceae bacterium]